MYRLTYCLIRIINGYAIGENFKICIQPRPKTSVIRYETTRSLSVPSLRPTKRSAGSNGDALIHSTIKLMQICRLLIHYSRGIVIEERSIVIVEYHRFSKKPLVVTEREKEWGRGRERERGSVETRKRLSYYFMTFHPRCRTVSLTETLLCNDDTADVDRHENGDGITEAAFHRWLSL